MEAASGSVLRTDLSRPQRKTSIPWRLYAALLCTILVAVFLTASSPGRSILGRSYVGVAQTIRYQGLSPLVLFPFLERAAVKAGAFPVRYEVEPGISFLLDPRDFIQHHIVYDEWEPEVWQAIASGLPENGVMLDVGANIGYYSLKAARRVGASGRVIAFEPNPETLRLLNENISASAAARPVTVVPIACTDSETNLTLYSGPDSNIGVASLSEENAKAFNPATRSFQVRARPIDHVVAELGLQRVDVMKIDTEGAELQVLKGARETLSRFRPRVVIEIVERQLEGMGSSVKQVQDVLRSAGYDRVRKIDETNEEWRYAGAASQPQHP